MSLLRVTYKVLSSLFRSRLILNIEERNGISRCGYRRNISTTNFKFCTGQILVKEWQCHGTVYKLNYSFWIIAPCSLVIGKTVSEAMLLPSSGLKFVNKEMYPLHCCLLWELGSWCVIGNSPPWKSRITHQFLLWQTKFHKHKKQK
jgi:hypothetical protein